MVGRTTFPLFPTDDGWPYPDVDGDGLAVHYGMVEEDPVDLDALELRADPHAFDALSRSERAALSMRFEHNASMKALARELGCTHGEARDTLGRAIDKVRDRLALDTR